MLVRSSSLILLHSGARSGKMLRFHSERSCLVRVLRTALVAPDLTLPQSRGHAHSDSCSHGRYAHVH